MSVSSRQADWAWLALLLLGLVGLRAWIMHAGGFELHFDEAQYWDWSRRLDWSYYSKGPLIAWLIALSEALFGHGEWQLRLFGWLASAGFLAVLYMFARDVWGTRPAAWWAVALGVFTPLYFSLGLAMTNDVFLFLFWSWGMWAAWRALSRGQRSAWYEVGAAIGLGALTKLSIGLLPFFGGLLVLLTPAWRHHLRDPHLWGGLLVMLICLSPVLAWNAANDWVMFRHEMGHAKHKEWSVLRSLQFLAEQALVLSPLVLAAAISVLWRRPVDLGQRFLWYVSLACLVFFAFKAASAKVLLNWPAPTYLGFLILFAGHIDRLAGWRRWFVYLGMSMSAVLLTIAMFPVSFGIPGDKDPFDELKSWRAPIEALAAQAPEADFVLVSTYTLAGELAFYWPKRITVYIYPHQYRRFNQYDLWPGLEREAGRTGIFVSKHEVRSGWLDEAFGECTPLRPAPAPAADGKLLRTLYAWLCTDYRAIEWPTPNAY